MTRAHPSINNEDAERCFVFYEWIRERADGLPIPTEREVRMSVTCHSLAIDHLLGIAVLLRDGIYPSAFALARPAYEGYVRGAWLRCCGMPADLDDFEADERGPSFFAMTQALEATPNFSGGVLSRVVRQTVPLLHSYAHGGYNQAARNWTVDGLEHNYSIEDVTQLARFVSAVALMSFQIVAVEAGRMDLVEEALELMKIWSERSPTKEYREDGRHRL